MGGWHQLAGHGRDARAGGLRVPRKAGRSFYAFHDRDVAPEGKTLRETNQNLDAIVKVLKQEQQRTGVGLLWGTACLFAHPRFAHGAARAAMPDVFAYAGAQVKKATM